jgi:hypothetical protein
MKWLKSIGQIALISGGIILGTQSAIPIKDQTPSTQAGVIIGTAIGILLHSPRQKK